MALAGRPKLLLADEPTTALDVSLRGQILELLRDLQREHGLAVLLITHDLPMVRQFADRILVMEKGHCVEQGRVHRVLDRPEHPYTRRLVDSLPVRDVRDEADDEKLIDAQQLTVDYPVPRKGWIGWFKKGRFRALDGVDFEIRRGQTLGVVGESGSGKSTLALALLGLHPHGGALTLWGQSWSHSKSADLALRRRIQVVFQDPFSSLSPRMTVGDIVAEGLRVHHPELSETQRNDRVLQALAEVGLDEQQFAGLLGRYPHEFSGGQRQRLAIARALIVEPEVLVLDEPTSALDVSIQKQILELLQTLQKKRGLSYVLITHDLAVVRAMAHQVIVLRQGRVVEQGHCARLMTHPEHEYTRTLIQASL
jgi:microcin C transport system ATP-binding protein